MWKVNPNESVSWDRFYFVRWYVDKEISLESAGEAGIFVQWGCNISLMDLQ